MPIEEFISKLTNPLDDLSNVRKLLGIYNNGDYYSCLVQANVGNSPSKRYYSSHEKNRFYVSSFNLWRKNIISMSLKDLETKYAHKVGTAKIDYSKVRNILAGISKFSKESEVREFLYKNNFGDDVKEFFLRCNPFDAPGTSSWTYAASRYVDGYRTPYFDILHRLYLSIDTLYVHRFANEFINKCLNRGLAFEFKFDEYGGRDDSVVIYCEDHNLPLFVSICEEIRRENPAMEGYISKPPLLTGVYNGWIGYGAEPTNSTTSYNNIRAQSIEYILDIESHEYFRNLKDKELDSNGVKYKIEEYISYLVYRKKVEHMKKNYQRRVANGLDVSNYDINLLNDRSYLSKIRIQINAFVDRNRDYLYEPFKIPQKFESIPDISGDKIAISTLDMIKCARDVFKASAMKDNAYLEKIRTRILEDSKNLGIAKKNYTLNQKFADRIDSYVQEKPKMHRVVSAKVTNNLRLYQEYFRVLEIIYNKRLRDDLSDINKLFHQLNLLKVGMDKIAVKTLSFSSDDIHERTQYYLYQMTVCLKNEDISGYEYMRTLYKNYELQASKKL